MKKIITILVIAIFSSTAFAIDYLVEPGDDLGGVDLFDYDTLLMTGGTANYLGLGGWSTGTIEDTDPLNVGGGSGGIWAVMTFSYSELTINDGEFYDLDVHGYSTVNLHGGDIFGDLTISAPTAWVHIYGYGFNNAPYMGGPVTGFWGDGTAFSIDLVDDTISTYDQIVFHVPEPGTLILLGLGGVLLRKRKL